MLTSLYHDPLTPRLAAIACPVLLLVGENDAMGPKASRIICDGLEPGAASSWCCRIAGTGSTWMRLAA
jgi:hypothetical protein